MAHHYDEAPDFNLNQKDAVEEWQKAGFKSYRNGELLECNKCGSVVTTDSWRKHLKWHESLARTARQADNASFHTTLIG